MSDDMIFQTDPSGQIITSYEKRSLLGSGGFAQCYEVVDMQTRQKYAAKIVPKKDLSDRKTKAKLLLQIKIHRTLKHKNIVGFEKVFEDKQNVYIIMELCQNQTLKEFQRRRSRLTEFEVRCYSLQLLDGIEYLHTNSIIHRDLKLGNVFINSKMQLKIGDFGLSTRLKSPKDKRYTTCGTPNYIAPQILAETGHSFQVDVWALGVMIYTLLVGKPAFQCQSVEDTYSKIKVVEYDFPPSIPLSEQVKDLITNILKKNPAQRLTIEQMRNHPFLNRQKNNIPDSLPSYTISIPPEGSYLRQYMPQQVVKITVMPRKISKRQLEDKENRLYLSTQKNKQQNKQLFLSNGNIRKQDLDKLHCQGRNRAFSQLGNTARQKIPLSPRHKANQYEADTNQIIKIYDLSHKYGVGYLLASGSIGMMFNDGTSLTQQQNYMYYNGKSMACYSNLPQNLKKKGEIINLIKNKLSSNSIIPFESDIYAKKCIKFKAETTILKLSNGIFQFFWPDGRLTLKGYKWITYQISDLSGQTTIMTQQLEPISTKIQLVKEFLKVFTEKRLPTVK